MAFGERQSLTSRHDHGTATLLTFGGPSLGSVLGIVAVLGAFLDGEKRGKVMIRL